MNLQEKTEEAADAPVDDGAEKKANVETKSRRNQKRFGGKHERKAVQIQDSHVRAGGFWTQHHS